MCALPGLRIVPIYCSLLVASLAGNLLSIRC